MSEELPKLLERIKYLVDNSACSMKLKQKIFLDMKEISRWLKILDKIVKEYDSDKESIPIFFEVATLVYPLRKEVNEQ